MAKKHPNHDLEIWPGFRFSIRAIEGIPMLNIDVDNIVVLFESGLKFLTETRKDMPVASKQDQNLEIKRKMTEKIVITKYD